MEIMLDSIIQWDIKHFKLWMYVKCVKDDKSILCERTFTLVPQPVNECQRRWMKIFYLHIFVQYLLLIIHDYLYGNNNPFFCSQHSSQPGRHTWWGYSSSVQFSHSVMADSLRPHEPQHTRPPCPSPTPGVNAYKLPQSHQTGELNVRSNSATPIIFKLKKLFAA